MNAKRHQIIVWMIFNTANNLVIRFLFRALIFIYTIFCCTSSSVFLIFLCFAFSICDVHFEYMKCSRAIVVHKYTKKENEMQPIFRARSHTGSFRFLSSHETLECNLDEDVEKKCDTQRWEKKRYEERKCNSICIVRIWTALFPVIRHYFETTP